MWGCDSQGTGTHRSCEMQSPVHRARIPYSLYFWKMTFRNEGPGPLAAEHSPVKCPKRLGKDVGYIHHHFDQSAYETEAK